MSAAIESVPVDRIGVDPLGPAARCAVDLASQCILRIAPVIGNSAEDLLDPGGLANG
jgi:hypothetical protein